MESGEIAYQVIWMNLCGEKDMVEMHSQISLRKLL